MTIYFGQIYGVLGASFPFSTRFQLRLGAEVTSRLSASAAFDLKYGRDWKLIFRISAKTSISVCEVRGPTMFRKAKNVEYSIFLPFDVIQGQEDIALAALNHLLPAVTETLNTLGFDVGCLEREAMTIAKTIAADPQTYDVERTAGAQPTLQADAAAQRGLS